MRGSPPFAYWKRGIPPVILSSANYDQVRTQGFGAPVRLTGTNFDKGVPVAYVDGVATTGTVIDATHMDVDMPAHAAGVNIPIMVDNGGGFAGDPVYVEYWSPLQLSSAPSGWWPSISDTGYTSVSTHIANGLGTLLDMSGNARNFTSNFSPVEGGPVEDNVVPFANQTTAGVRYLQTADATSVFIPNNAYTMWALIRQNNNGTNTWPDGNVGFSWVGMTNFNKANDAFGCGIGTTGAAFTPTLTGKAMAYVFDGGQRGVQWAGLSLDEYYLVVGTFSAGVVTLYVNDVSKGTDVGVGNISDRTGVLQMFSNPNRTVTNRGEQPDTGICPAAIDATSRLKLLKYHRQAYGVPLPAV